MPQTLACVYKTQRNAPHPVRMNLDAEPMSYDSLLVALLWASLPNKGLNYKYINNYLINNIVTCRVRRSRGEMYIGHGRLCLCLCVYLSVSRCIPTLLHGPGYNF